MSILFQENYIKRRFLFWNYLQSFRIPTDMFTVMFAIGRLPGWIAQWKEMRRTKNQ
jgi:citrate synthase